MESKRIAIVLYCGDYHVLNRALSQASSELAGGGEVSIFLTYQGLNMFVRRARKGPNQTNGIHAGGSAARDTRLIRNKLAQARKLGLKMYACAGSLSKRHISRRDLIERVDGVESLSKFLERYLTATTTWYI